MLNEGIMTSGQGLMTPQPPHEGAQQYCLRWNSYPATVATQLAQLRQGEDFVDVTLACEGQQLRAHKIVLSACSPYFMQLFKSTPCHHPVVFLRDVRFSQLRALLEFMYAGEVNVSQGELPALLRTAEALQVRGLADTTNNNFGSQLPLPQKPIFTQHQQQYIPAPPPIVTQPMPTLPPQVPSQIPSPHPQNPPLLHMPMETGDQNPQLTSENLPQQQPTTSQQLLQQVSSKVQEGGTRHVSNDVENESSKENMIDVDSSDSNDSQEDYVPGFQYEEKSKSTQQQPMPTPVLATSPSALNTPDGARNMSDAGADSWNLVTLGTISLRGTQSEVEMSEEDEIEDDDEEEEEDDGEFDVKVPMPPVSSETSSDNTQESGGGESRVNPNGANVPGPSMMSSFPLPPTPDSDKSKDLKLENPGDLPPRHRFSRALWPPGVPYHGPQQCPYCPRVLSNVGNWRKHVLTMHFAREKNFKCCHCNSSFRTSEYLQKHYVRVHSYAPKMSRKKGLLGTGGGAISSPGTITPNPPDIHHATKTSNLNLLQ